MNANMIDPALAHFRGDIERGMSSAMWKEIFDHHLHAGIGGDRASTQFVLWLMTLLDDELLAQALDRNLLRRLTQHGKRRAWRPASARQGRQRKAPVT